MSTQTFSSTSLTTGDHIGPYQLITQLGEGGFARVWQAQQTEPLVRQVALKVLKPGMGSTEILRRFQLEQEALAQMNHPGIARVLDAGHTESGQPYFAMELVQDGKPITTYCEINELKLTQRLELFLQLCSAIHHAHQQGLIHRDLKPSNVLVSPAKEGAQVKVIDFGIAKALIPAAPQDIDLTQAGALGTQGYMSPEQALNGEDVDTRSDVYALGALLKTLLGDDPPQDLVWITCRCLEHERSLRYASAAALAEDIQCYLDHRPITARAPSTTYRVSMLVQRHRTLTVAAVLALISLGTGIVVALDQAKLARLKQRQSEAMTRVLLDSWKNTTATESKDTSLPVMLRQVMTKIAADDFGGGLETRCRTLLKISEAANIQGDYALGYESALAAQKWIETSPNLDIGITIDCLTNIGNNLSYSGKPNQAIPYLRQAWEHCLKKEGPVSTYSLTRQRMLGAALAKAAGPEAISLIQDTLEKGRTLGLPVTHTDMIQSSSDLATAKVAMGLNQEALELLDETITNARQAGEPLRDLVVRLLLRRGILLIKMLRYDDAITSYQEAETEARRATPPDTGILFMLQYNIGLAHMRAERPAQTVTILEPLFEEQVRYFGILHQKTRSTALTLARARVALEQWTQLEQLLDRVLKSIPQGKVYSTHDEHIEALAQHYEKTGKADQAIAWRSRISKKPVSGK